MKIIAQPDSYSDILERVFATTLASGLLYTVVLAQASPAFHTFLNSVSTTADLGLLKGLRALYVLVPLLIALASRALRLHDRISDVLRLRLRFDTDHILAPMATRAGISPTEDLRQRLRANRTPAMYAVFYPYAGFPTPVIDRQLVRSALDDWGWFWVALEAAFLGTVTLVPLALLGQWYHVLGVAIAVSVLVAFDLFQWRVCRGNALDEVDAIMRDPARASAVRGYFMSLLTGSKGGDSGPSTAGTTGASGLNAPVASTPDASLWDAFICHASEDKEALVDPLAAELRRRGLRVWYDLWVLSIGDSLRRKIDEGLAKSRFGIVILSHAFFDKEWPRHELDGLVQREIDGRKVILPVWHNVTRADVMKYSVTLADKLAGSSSKGIVALADELERAIRS